MVESFWTELIGNDLLFDKSSLQNKQVEIFSAHSTRLDKPEKTALAEFLRFLALKKVFSNHQK